MISRGEAVRRIGAAVPGPLRGLRARMLLDCYVDRMGIEEVVCPGCEGDGWCPDKRERPCPICLGFREVPVSLADWFQEELTRLQYGLERDRMPEPPDGVRYGRNAEAAHRMSPASAVAGTTAGSG